MSSYKSIIVFVILIILSGCSSKNEVIKNVPNYGEKAFELEDFDIILALSYENMKDYSSAKDIYLDLYKKSKKKIYLIKALKNEILIGDIKSAKTMILELEKGDFKSFRKKDIIEFYRIAYQCYLLDKNNKQALDYLFKLLELEKSEVIYEYIANIYFLDKDYSKAIKYLETAYSFNHDERILSRIVSIFYVNLNEKNKAISYLESHIRLYEFSKFLADKLLLIYAEDVNIDGMINVYINLYNNKKESKDFNVIKNLYLDKIIKLYVLKNDIDTLIVFLEKEKIYDERLLEAYHINNQNIKARDLAKNLYFETKSSEMLAKWAIFDYETKDLKDKKFVIKISKRLEKALNNYKSATFYNYLGYLLIDYDIDVKKGMKWVEKSLLINPQSPFYLDSLAWAYYKLQRYEEAYNTMKKVVDSLGLEDSDVKKHWKLISDKYTPKKNKLDK